jgi:hypothetical protein
VNPELLHDQWKEINENARHWETLVFENATTFINLVALALGAAGAVVVWPSISHFAQTTAIVLFLIAAAAFSACAITVIVSTKNYLKGFYDRRHELEASTQDLRLRNTVTGPGSTLAALVLAFVVALVISLFLLAAAVAEPPRAILEGAKLSGADLSSVRGLSQRDLQGACGDSSTKLATSLTLRHCSPVSDARPDAQPTP